MSESVVRPLYEKKTKTMAILHFLSQKETYFKICSRTSSINNYQLYDGYNFAFKMIPLLSHDTQRVFIETHTLETTAILTGLVLTRIGFFYYRRIAQKIQKSKYFTPDQI